MFVIYTTLEFRQMAMYCILILVFLEYPIFEMLFHTLKYINQYRPCLLGMYVHISCIVLYENNLRKTLTSRKSS